ncbi:LysE family translocator [Cupriavidus taiwanensis]|uniref:Lysine exporter protein (LYSE/YGGA) n=2 Tax=Cupriavidus taiwanensis TaxID=164546 RepID=B3R5I3_CUPTR|nr:LysE family translocator [Cupriavidus taiwanensis]CAQ70092.1 putative Lysine exporter protein (LYSE/YGGA) [Cupriavidus taiwanensis LMG 19424]SOY45259.1 putative Lysine exporter protein (LYSE/YGGA) [Cupriavidus taiwanensis]SOY88457.1 putative Lysine exporter protein (LYSE/YGGA) [Cupriavidus taiwanensis]SOZ06003.1 putative Lysine exporter protein (LYSE/YGGA) [Cupriavidus taiwanensis]SOZ07988.1 putative Lysine exporter protein (LYSE/YGGA) [Cupriavidus taiwanensis]
MTELLPPWPLLTAFVVASLALAITPGPAVVYIVTRTLAQGRQAGLASIGAVALGNLGNAIGASLGLAVLFSVSALAFTVVKYAGAAYLIWLGVRALRGGGGADGGAPEVSPRSLRQVVRDGFVVALLNPKTAIFFAAFLPQFMNPAGSALAQSLALGVAFVLIAATTDACYVMAAAAVMPALRRAGRARALGRYLTGAAFIGLGVFTAASGSRAPK